MAGLALVRWWRLRPWNRSPLMRRGDRVEAVLILAASVLLVVLAPIAAEVSLHTYTRLQHHSELVRATVHPVTAVLLEDATPAPPGGVPMQPPSVATTAPARWSVNGHPHTGQVPTSRGATAGQTVTVLVDATGALADDGSSGPGNATVAVAVGCGIWGLAAGATGALLAGAHRVLLARRLRNWSRAWDDYDPGPPRQ